MNPQNIIKKLFGQSEPEQTSEQTPAASVAAEKPIIPSNSIYSDRLFWAIKQAAKSRIAAINNQVMPVLNEINVKDEDLTKFFDKSWQELETELADYLCTSGMVKGLAAKYIAETLDNYHKRKVSTFDPNTISYVAAPAGIPDPIKPYIIIKKNEQEQRVLDLDLEGMKIFAWVEPTAPQVRIIKRLEEIAAIMNQLKQLTGQRFNDFMQFIINDSNTNTVHVDAEWIVTGIQGVSPYLSVNLNNLTDPTKPKE